MNKTLSDLVVLSLFDGISCGRQALIKAKISVARYLASEICKDAINITQFHHPSTEQLGDVRYINGYNLRGIVNLLIGGSPCQNFSMAGRRKGMTTICQIEVTSLDQYLQLKSEGFEFEGQSYLFWEFVRLLKEIQPKYFLLENVDMKNKKWIRVISDALGVEPIYINSKVASGQSRPRLYWSNIPYTEIEDKEIFLGDVVLGAVTGTNRHGEKNKTGYGVKWPQGNFKYQPDNKSYCITRGGGRYKNTQGDIKRFTAEDCERLQTIDKGYTNVTGLCKTRRIKLIGNAWTVDVIVEAFFKNLPWSTKMKVDSRVPNLIF